MAIFADSTIKPFTAINPQDFKYREKREAMVATLKEYGIKNARVLEAFRTVKRHLFIDSGLWDRAYEDSALPLASRQTISQPYTVAFMTEFVADNYAAGSKVLEIGTGSGYQAAILVELGYKVWTIERVELLFENTGYLLKKLGISIERKLGDGTVGWPEAAPFDAILVTAGSPDVPHPLLEQLAENGRLVVPIGNQKQQKMSVFHRIGDTVSETVTHSFTFVPLIGEAGWKQS
ncbi:MAG: protein-L-isoaspartate(D-aspartate) O-methyltransferase [Chloroherpetonaceae bacterium]|nr:protein-L-isoaspartate(D-aspartate) O-methyltransferase [Chloroherpetonaceae bacterium]